MNLFFNLLSRFVVLLLVLLSFTLTGETSGQQTRRNEQRSPATTKPIELTFEHLTSIPGTEKWDWWQARTAYIPGPNPMWITTMSETGKTGTHNFHDIYQTTSRDSGTNWSTPITINSLMRTKQKDGCEVAAGDLWPKWHAKTNRVLATGKTFNFEGGIRENRLKEQIAYAEMNVETGQWGPLQYMEMPEKDHAGFKIIACNAGCTQRVDLPNGEILLPVRYWRDPKKQTYTSIVARCRFDGKKLIYLEHGSELTIPRDRGLYEPSLVHHGDYYYLTLRADHSAFVTRGNDGINFEPIQQWKYDDGKLLGSYNTQQHWVTIAGRLFLVYTRRAANNDHVFRHRAPLFISQVNPETLQVIRSSERILIPENHATLGNSGVCRISDNESWITCGEGLLRLGERRGQKNKVHVVKITPKK